MKEKRNAMLISWPGPILESKGMRAICEKKGKKMLKKGKVVENLGENVQNLKIFRNRAGDYVR